MLRHMFILGFLLFLYGANCTNDIHRQVIVGYTGLYLSIGSIMAYLVIYIYKEFTKKPTCLKPASEPVN